MGPAAPDRLLAAGCWQRASPRHPPDRGRFQSGAHQCEDVHLPWRALAPDHRRPTSLGFKAGPSVRGLGRIVFSPCNCRPSPETPTNPTPRGGGSTTNRTKSAPTPNSGLMGGDLDLSPRSPADLVSGPACARSGGRSQSQAPPRPSQDRLNGSSWKLNRHQAQRCHPDPDVARSRMP